MMNKNDPYTVSLALSEANRRKAMRAGAFRMPGQQPKVVDQDIAEMAGVDAMGNITGALPENIGIGRLPAPNLAPIGKAEGGIIGYADRGFVQRDPNWVFTNALRGLFEREGGETTDQGGRTKYGISSRGHPNVDIDKLTLNDAAKIYKRDYWDAYGLDKLAKKNPQLAAATFDTFVNHPPAFAKKALEESGGDVNKLLDIRRNEYERLATGDPSKHAGSLKGWNKRLEHVAASVANLPTEGEGDVVAPQTTAQAAPQTQTAPIVKEDARGVASIPMSAAALGANAGIATPVYEAFKPTFKPGTTAREALTRTGVAAAVPLATYLGGAAASNMARNNLQLMSPEQRKELSDNALLSAMSGDTGLAAAIMNAGQSTEPPPKTSPYGKQMSEVGSFLGDIALGRKGRGVGALLGNGPKEETVAPPASTDRLSPQVPDELKQIEAAQRSAAEDVQVKPPEAPTAAAEGKTTGGGGLASLFKDPAFYMAMRLLANKNPNFAGAFGEAGIGTVGDVAAAEKAASESEYRKALGKYYGSYAEAIERGAKEKNEVQLAEKSAQEALDTWAKNNKMALLQSPALYDQMRDKYRREAYTSYGIKMPTMAAGSPDVAGGGFKLLGVRPG
jgi:lysozyme family protein